MKLVIAVLLIMIFAGCSIRRTSHPVPIGFYPDFKGEGFIIDLWMDNQPLSQGKEVIIPENQEPRAQLTISNLLPGDVFMRVECDYSITGIVESIPNGRNAVVKAYGAVKNPKNNEFLLLRGIIKTKDNYRGPDSYHRWINLPKTYKHFKVSGTIKIFYYIGGDPKEYAQEKKFNFIVKRKME